MCLAIYKPAGKSIPRDVLIRAATQHQDGVGIAVCHDTHFETYRSLHWNTKAVFELLDRSVDRPAIVHYRMATHGTVTLDNVHPFPLVQRDGQHVMVMHNGVLWDYHPDKDDMTDRSDTRVFIDEFLSKLEPTWWTDEVFIKQLEADLDYNKVVVVWPTGGAVILNEALGTWDNDIWYSNDSGFAPKPKSAALPAKVTAASTSKGEVFWGEVGCWLDDRTEEPMCVRCGSEAQGDLKISFSQLTHDPYFNTRHSCSACKANLKATFWNERMRVVTR